MTKESLFNVAAYLRLSREDGDKAESDSVGNQRKLISDYLRNKSDFILYDEYVDDGFTGTNFNRPAFQKMIADIESGLVNCVIVKDLSRFGRDYIDTGKYLERYFPDRKIRFISIMDNIDSMKQSYDILLPIKNIFNEQYARDISNKVHSAMQTKQKAGEFIGAFSSYGYKKAEYNKNKLVIDDYAAGIVRRIFEMYIAGNGKIRIAHILNSENILCPSEYKKINGENYRNCNRLDTTFYWTYSTIHHILQNEIYLGNMVQGRTYQKMRGKARQQDREDWIIVEGTHEAIIDLKTWNKAQNLLKRRTRNLDLNSNVSIFAGFLKCGDCGRALVKKASGKNSGSRISYYCGTYVRSGTQYCTPHTISYSVLESVILNDLRTIIQNVGDLHSIINQVSAKKIKSQDTTHRQADSLTEELNKVRRLKKSVYEDYKNELISKDEYIEYRQDYLKKEELLTKQLDSLANQKNADNTTDIFSSPWINRLLELGTVEKLDRDIVVEMIHEIIIFENRKIKIIYNFSNDLESLFATVYSDKKVVG